MSRPIYETEKDRQAEMEIAQEFVRAKWDCDIFKNPIQYRVDFALLKPGNVVFAWAEIKTRPKYRKGDFSTYLLSLEKVIRGKELARETGKPAFLIVQWTDALGWMDFEDIRPDEWVIEIGGRSDRGDPQDQEPCLMIPIRFFKRADEC
jgi:hypothetical protein